eukprot:5213743-Alexandrium_andersonii.AAC.1
MQITEVARTSMVACFGKQSFGYFASQNGSPAWSWLWRSLARLSVNSNTNMRRMQKLRACERLMLILLGA